MNDGERGRELRTAGPTAVLDAEDVERERRCASGNDAVLADDAVLLAAADQFAGEEQQRAAAAIDQEKLVDGSAGAGLGNVNGAAVATANHGFGTLLANEHLTVGETLFESEEGAGVLAEGADDGEDGDVLIGGGIKEPPVALGPRRRSGRGARGRADKSQAAERGDTKQSADQGGENRTFHESLLCVNPDPVRANQRGHDSGLERGGENFLHGGSS